MLLVVCPECQKIEEFNKSFWEKFVLEYSRWVGTQRVEIGESKITAVRHECGFEVENSIDIPLSGFEPEDVELTLFGVSVVEGKIDWLGIYWKQNKEKIQEILKEKGLIS